MEAKTKEKHHGKKTTCELVNNALEDENWDGQQCKTNATLCSGNCLDCEFYLGKRGKKN